VNLGPPAWTSQWAEPLDSAWPLVLGIDPGAKSLGLSIFSNGALSGAWYFEGTPKQLADKAEHAVETIGGRVDVVVLEAMVSYPGRASARAWATALDLLQVTRTGAFIAGHLRPNIFQGPTAVEWKGTVPKAIHQKRILKTLSPLELGTWAQFKSCMPPARAHNALDAIGLGLWHLKRLGPGLSGREEVG
jgi:hypothetical protein